MSIIQYLNSIGIKIITEVVRNPSYEQLFAEECSLDLDGYERGFINRPWSRECRYRNLYRALTKG